MFRHRRTWLRAAAVLVGVWVIAIGVIAVASSRIVTPERFARWVAENRMKNVSGEYPGRRDVHLERLAHRLHQLSPQQRLEPMVRLSVEGEIAAMDEAEQARFFVLVEPDLDAMLKAMRDMPLPRQRAMIGGVLHQLRDEQGVSLFETDATLAAVYRPLWEEGLPELVRVATPRQKLAMLPLLDAMRVRLRQPPMGMGGLRGMRGGKEDGVQMRMGEVEYSASHRQASDAAGVHPGQHFPNDMQSRITQPLREIGGGIVGLIRAAADGRGSATPKREEGGERNP